MNNSERPVNKMQTEKSKKPSIPLIPLKDYLIIYYQHNEFEDFLVTMAITSEHGTRPTDPRKIIEYMEGKLKDQTVSFFTRFLCSNKMIHILDSSGNIVENPVQYLRSVSSPLDLTILPIPNLVDFVKMLPWNREKSKEVMKKILFRTPVYKKLISFFDRPLTWNELVQRIEIEYCDKIKYTQISPTILLLSNYSIAEYKRVKNERGEKIVQIALEKDNAALDEKEKDIQQVLNIKSDGAIVNITTFPETEEMTGKTPKEAENIPITLIININLPCPLSPTNDEIMQLRDTIDRIKKELENPKEEETVALSNFFGGAGNQKELENLPKEEISIDDLI